LARLIRWSRSRRRQPSESPRPAKKREPARRKRILRLTLAFAGFGNVGRALARMLIQKREDLASRHQLLLPVTGIATAAHGFAINPRGLQLAQILRRIERGQSLTALHRGLPVRDTLDFIRRRPAQVLLELTPLNPWTGLPAVDHVRSALGHGLHVVTANKGPLAVAYRELKELAAAVGCAFRYEATVLDGAPVFNLLERALPGTEILGFHGLVNSTCNFILTEMERGVGFKTALRRAQRLGVTEADPSYDIEGWDAAAKTAVLVNVLMGREIRSSDVTRMGIAAVSLEQVKQARRKGKALRLVARAATRGERVFAWVAPEFLDLTDPLAHVVGTSSALALETDTLKELILIEQVPSIEQTAYGVLSDLLTIASDLRREAGE
jgi:homoserine dehydrogenase